MSNLIPSDWIELEVREAFELGRGRVISKPEILENPGIYPVYSSQSTNQGKMGAINTYDFDGEYITWTTDGAYAGTVFHRTGKFNCTNVCGTLKDKGEYKVHPKFVASYLETVAKNHVSYVGNPKLMNGTFAEILFLLPPLPEQQKIAAILTTVDDVVESTQAQINKLKDLKTGMMKELLTKGIGHSEFKDSPVGRIPKAWTTKKIQDLASYITSGSRGWAEYYSEKGAIFIRIGNLTREHINFRFNDIVYVNPPEGGEGKRTLVQVGDVLISITADLGIVGVVNESIGEAYVNQHVSLVRLNDIKKSRWVGHYLSHENAQKQFTANNDSGAKAGLNLTSIRNLDVALPPDDEMNKIVNSLDSIDIDIVKRKEKLVRFMELKKALMQDLLTGKVRVKVN